MIVAGLLERGGGARRVPLGQRLDDGDQCRQHALRAQAHGREAIRGRCGPLELGADGRELARIGRWLDHGPGRLERASGALEGPDARGRLDGQRIELDEHRTGVGERLPRRRLAVHDARGAGPRQLEGRLDGTLQRIERRIGRGRPLGHEGPRAGGDRWIWTAGAEQWREGHDSDEGSEQRRRAYHGVMDLAASLRTLPKAELHQHLDGSVRPETAVELGAEIGLELTLEEARRRMVGPERCADQAELLTYFDLPIAVLQTAGALERATGELIDDLAADRITYAEIRWGPRLHLERGLSVRDVLEAVATGVAGRAAVLGPRMPLIGLIVTAMRSHPPAANVELARIAGEFGHPIVGFDLAGPEAAYPSAPHALAFVTAREAGLAITAHAGEVADPKRVRETLDFGVRRVAHGVTAAEDPDLLALLRGRGVTLDLCPTSNVQAGIVASLAEHPLARLHRDGVSVTISTDDRTVTGITLSQEMARCFEALGLTRDELAAIALNGFERGFAPEALRLPRAAEARVAWDAWRSGRSIS